MLSILATEENYDDLRAALNTIHEAHWALKNMDGKIVTKPLVRSQISAKQLDTLLRDSHFELAICDEYCCYIKDLRTGRLLEHA